MPNDSYPEITEGGIDPHVSKVELRSLCFQCSHVGRLDVLAAATSGAPLLLLAPTHRPRARVWRSRETEAMECAPSLGE